MKTTTQSLAFAVIGSLLLASPLSMAASLTDQYDSFVLYHEIETSPAVEADRLTDFYDPYVLSHEIVTTKTCTDPVHELIADNNDSFITPAEFISARQSRRC